MTRSAVLITGGAIRLGKAIATGLAAAGEDIALHYNASAEAALATQAEIQALGVECRLFRQDLADASALDALVERVQAEMPALKTLVNSASAYESGPIASTSVEQFSRQFDVNLRAPFFLTQAFCARVESGAVINICDNKVAFNQYEYAAYLLSKKTLAEFTLMAALEYAPRFRVNGVMPGVTMPLQSRSEEYIQWRLDGIPLRRQGTTADIVGAVRYLLESPFVNGQLLYVDGGEAMAHIGRNATQYDPSKV